jgi:hypothetical protein
MLAGDAVNEGPPDIVGQPGGTYLVRVSIGGQEIAVAIVFFPMPTEKDEELPVLREATVAVAALVLRQLGLYLAQIGIHYNFSLEAKALL